jgi:hypothetical protein
MSDYRLAAGTGASIGARPACVIAGPETARGRTACERGLTLGDIGNDVPIIGWRRVPATEWRRDPRPRRGNARFAWPRSGDPACQRKRRGDNARAPRSMKRAPAVVNTPLIAARVASGIGDSAKSAGSPPMTRTSCCPHQAMKSWTMTVPSPAAMSAAVS